MKPTVGRPLAIIAIVVGAMWLLPFGVALIIFVIRGDFTLGNAIVAVSMLIVLSSPGFIVIWRAKMYLHETRTPPRQRRGFQVLPPR